LLRGIRDHIGEIATLAVEIVINFANTLVTNAFRLVEAAVTLLLSFLGAIAGRAADIVAGGVNLLVAFISGITNNLFKIVEAVASLISAFITAIFGNLGRIITAGVDAVIAFVTGIGRDLGKVVTAGVDVVLAFIRGVSENAIRFARTASDLLITFLNELAAVIREKAPELAKAGRNLAEAIIGGIVAGLKEIPILGAVVGLADKIVGGFKERIESSSPSKVFIRIGKSITEGLAYAFDNDTLAENSAVSKAESIVRAFEATLNHIPDTLAGMDEFNPVITPVLDLTKVQMASRDLDRFMSVSAITPEVSYNRARLISTTADLESTVGEVPAYAGPTEVTFEQNIYAPTALSTNDIYRNTKSQIVLAKEELNIP
jgi:hypothetical protein